MPPSGPHILQMNKCNFLRSVATRRLCYKHFRPPSRHRLDSMYEVLQVKFDSSVQEIRTAYIKLSKQLHPDVNGKQMGSDEFVRICEAYQTLRKPLSRKLHDRQLLIAQELHAPIDTDYSQPNIGKSWEKFKIEIRKRQVGRLSRPSKPACVTPISKPMALLMRNKLQLRLPNQLVVPPTPLAEASNQFGVSSLFDLFDAIRPASLPLSASLMNWIATLSLTGVGFIGAVLAINN